MENTVRKQTLSMPEESIIHQVESRTTIATKDPNESVQQVLLKKMHDPNISKDDYYKYLVEWNRHEENKTREKLIETFGKTLQFTEKHFDSIVMLFKKN